MNTTTRRLFLHSSALALASSLIAPRSAAADTPAGVEPPPDLWETFQRRRSVRSFQPTPVPDADLWRILDAARSAPTSGNQQPWKFLVVRHREKIAALRSACIDWRMRQPDYPRPETEKERRELRARAADYYSGYLSAPVYVVVLVDNQAKHPHHIQWDGALAAGYLMLAARALGYGTVFITDAIPEEVTRKAFAVPDRYLRICITPIGVPTEWPEEPRKKPVNDFIALDSF